MRLIEKKMVPEYGITLDGVWIPYSMLEELSQQGPYDSEFYYAYIRPNREQEKVLTDRGLAEKETRGGLHWGPNLAALIDDISWEGT